jgi:NADH-quinone oxidoreductase subunit L
MGGLKKWMPYTYATYLLSTLAIAGIPPFSGFFSKDEILWKAFSGGHQIVWFVAVCAAAMTAFYMFRSVYMTFEGESRADDHTRHHLHESPLAMTVPLMILAALATFAGFLNVPHALFGDARFDAWLAPVVTHGEHGAHGGAHHVEIIEYVLMVFSVAVAVGGILVARAMYQTRTLKPDWLVDAFGGKLYRTVYNKYYVDEAYDATVIAGTMNLSRVLSWFDSTIVDGIVNGAALVVRLLSQVYGLFDRYVVDGAVNGVGALTSLVGGGVRRLQTGNINAYLYVIVLAVVGLMMARIW